MLIYLSALETDNERREFMVLYSEYHEVMLRVAKKYFPSDQMMLEDAVQNAWMKVIKNFQGYLMSRVRKEVPTALLLLETNAFPFYEKRKTTFPLMI